MRIAYISYEFPPDTGRGGIGTYIHQIASSLASDGNDIHVFAGSNTRSQTTNENGYWVHLIQCNNGEDFRVSVVAVFDIYQSKKPFHLMESAEINGNAWEIKKKYPQLSMVVRLHAPNWLVEHLKKRYISFPAKARFVLGSLRRFHFDMGFWRYYEIKTDADYQFTQLADGITAPSDAMKQWAVKNWNIPPGKIIVLPNVFNPPDAFLKIPISQLDNYKTIVFFGRLNVLKGLVNASKAMKKILIEYPCWKFRVIGDDGRGPNTKISMRRWMKDLLQSVIRQVEFIDGMQYEEIADNIDKAEIVLLPSLFESFSYTCIEAMAAGKAIVGSKSGGMADLLQNEKTGMLVDPENYRDIYRALKKLIGNNELRYNISLEARKWVSTTYTASAVAEKFMAYYRQMSDYEDE